jgi:hypothetical protein
MYGSLLAMALLTPGGNACADEACPKIPMVCVAEPTMKVKTKVVYGCKVTEYCLPQCGIGGMFSCDDCPKCGKVKTKSQLVIFVRKTECPSYKCVPVPAPCIPCAPACAPACAPSCGPLR